jgi:uncharacterized protein YuzE
MTTVYRLKISDDDQSVAYIEIDTGRKRLVDRQIRINDLIEGIIGPDLVIDIDREGHVLGIEIIG